jgi:hypothetical protein
MNTLYEQTHQQITFVKIGQTHSCQCLDFAKNGEKELYKHIIWVLLFICKVPETSELLQQMFLTRTEIYEILCNTLPVENWVKHIEGERQQNRQEFVANLLQNDDATACYRTGQ